MSKRSIVRNNLLFNRKFSTPVDPPKAQGNVIDLLSRKGNEGVESRFKFGGGNVKLEDLSEFSEDEKLLPQYDEDPLFDDSPEDGEFDTGEDSNTINEECYLSGTI